MLIRLTMNGAYNLLCVRPKVNYGHDLNVFQGNRELVELLIIQNVYEPIIQRQKG